jgi:hypothetical protein
MFNQRTQRLDYYAIFAKALRTLRLNNRRVSEDVYNVARRATITFLPGALIPEANFL